MAAYVGMTFAGVYAVFVLLVYFAQTTSVRFEELRRRWREILDYSQRWIIFLAMIYWDMGDGTLHSLSNGP